MRRLIFDGTGASQPGRLSDAPPANPQLGEDDTTFVFDIPARSRREDTPIAEPFEDTAGDMGANITNDIASVVVAEHRQGYQILRPTRPDSIPTRLVAPKSPRRTERKAKIVKKSRHGIAYPSLPQAVVKSLAVSSAKGTRSGRAKITRDVLEALTEATDWFFEQIGEDLEVYAGHAGRKTIDESDVITLMKRYDCLPHSCMNHP